MNSKTDPKINKQIKIYSNKSGKKIKWNIKYYQMKTEKTIQMKTEKEKKGNKYRWDKQKENK